jgi:hypothetical protein
MRSETRLFLPGSNLRCAAVRSGALADSAALAAAASGTFHRPGSAAAVKLYNGVLEGSRSVHPQYLNDSWYFPSVTAAVMTSFGTARLRRCLLVCFEYAKIIHNREQLTLVIYARNK